MAGSYKTNNNPYGIRSISLHTRPPPSTDSIKKELNNIETWVISSSRKPSIDATYDGLLKLSRLYECMHELMNMLSSTRKEKWVDELMDRLVRFLDVCGIMKDIMSRYKEHVRDLQRALRRRNGDLSIIRSIAQYNSFRKTVKKDVKRLMASLKQTMVVKSQDNHHEVVTKMVIEATVSVFESVLMPFIMSNSQTPKTYKWSIMVSKLIRKTCEEHQYQQTNDIEGLNVVLRSQCIKVSSCWNDACMWEAMEAQIETIEDGLECIFRSLIRTSVSLLNIVSNY